MSKALNVGIVGANSTGCSIAQKMVMEGLSVTIYDTQDERLDYCLGRINDSVKQGIEKGKIDISVAMDIMNRVTTTKVFEDFRVADLIIDASFESTNKKAGLFSSLNDVCRDSTVYATVANGKPVSEAAACSGRADRFIGLHYVSDPAQNRLVEIIPVRETSKESVDKGLQIARGQGKTAILVRDVPGFAISRLSLSLCTEALRMLEEKVANVQTIEEAAKRAFYTEKGPFELIHEQKPQHILSLSELISSDGDFLYSPPTVLKNNIATKDFFLLDGIVDYSRFGLVIERLYAAVFYSALKLVEDDIAASVEDVDRGSKIGLRWRYGPYELMNRVGINEAYRIVKDMCRSRDNLQIPTLLVKHKKKEMPFEFRYVDLEIKNGLALVTINRPEAMNALNRDIIEQLTNIVRWVESDPDVKAIVIQGAGKAFVAGADIKYFVDNIKSDNIAANYIFTRQGHDLFSRLEESPKLTVALVDGLSLGSGSELALACQAIVATPGSSFGFPETSIGLFPGLGGMIRLERHLGRELAKYFVFTGSMISAEEAYQLGLVTKLVARVSLIDAVHDLLEEGSPDKYRQRKIPVSFNKKIAVCSDLNIQRLLNGELPLDVDPEFAELTLKQVAEKAPIALRMANELIDRQSGIPIDDAVELELARLFEIFAAQDTLIGLESHPGQVPQYRGL